MKSWTKKPSKLNKKLVVRVPSELFDKLEVFVENNPRFATVSEFVRYLLFENLYDQVPTQTGTGLGVDKKQKEGEKYGRTEREGTNQGQWETE
jgi:Arc/MetJ-type ribon-helix-helix transcriptional regulator